MSVINQMLRDLDARGAAPRGAVPKAFSAAQGPLAAGKPGATARLAMGLLPLLAMGGVAGFLALSGTSGVEGNAAPAEEGPRGADTARVADVRVSHGEQQRVSPAPTPRPPVAGSTVTRANGAALPAAASHQPASVPAVPNVPTVQTSRTAQRVDAAQPQAAAKSLVPQAVVVAAVAQAEPAVVKKMTELPPEVEAQQYLDDAQALRRSGKIDAAIGKYRQALERSPGMRNARIQLASVLQENGQPDAAMTLLKAGYEQQADDALAIAVGRLLADQGRRDESLRWLERGSGGLRPADHALMGALLSQAQRYEDAVKAYQRALAMNPHQGGWLLGLGLALESLGRVDEAQVAYRNALGQGEFRPEVVGFLRQKIRASGP